MKKSQLALWIFIIIIFLIGVQIVFSIPAPCKWLAAVWDAGDFISFVGTMALGLIAVYQTKNANELSYRMLQVEEEKRRPQIDIRRISKDKLHQYNIQQLISSSIENTYVSVNSEWKETINTDGDNFWFEIKNVKKADIIDIQPITVISQIIDSDEKCVTSNEYTLSTSCNLNMIEGNDAVPFLLGMNNIWTKVAEKPGQKLVLSFEFWIKNYDGEEYKESISLTMINAWDNDDVLSPSFLAKKVGKSVLLADS